MVWTIPGPETRMSYPEGVRTLREFENDLYLPAEIRGAAFPAGLQGRKGP